MLCDVSAVCNVVFHCNAIFCSLFTLKVQTDLFYRVVYEWNDTSLNFSGTLVMNI